MASIQSLLRRGSLVPDGMGSFRLQMDTKFKWDTAKLKRKVGEARARSLKNVGLMVRKRTQRAMSNRKPRSENRPKNMTVGTRMGFQLVAQVLRVPMRDRVTSWKTPRHPKGFLRQDIQTDYDMRSQSVVVGPAKRPKINSLLEFGGTTSRYFVPIAKRARRNRVYGTLANTPPRAGKGRDAPIQTGIYRFNVRIKKRGFMAKGLRASLAKIPAEFKDQIRGP